LIVDLMILGLLVAEVLILSRLDRRRFGTWLTPFTTLAYPYTVVAILAYFLAPLIDFVPLYTGSVLVWIVGLFVMWSAGTFLGWGLLDVRLSSGFYTTPIEPAGSNDDRAVRWAVRLAWASMPFMLYGVFASAKSAGGWAEFGSIDFRDAYSHGLHAHAVVLATLLSIFLIGVRQRGDKRLLVTIVMLLVFITLGRVKGTILQAIIGGIFFRMMRGQFRLSLRKMGMLGLISYVVFNIVYLISMSVLSSDDPFNPQVYSFLARHYLFYLFAGPLAFGEAMRSGVYDVGGDWHVIFSPFINLYHAGFGGAILASGSAHEKGMDTDLLAKVGDTNVYSFFGTLHLYLGAYGAVLYAFVAGLLCYGFLIVTRRANSAWLTASYCLIAAQLTFGFFELYFWLLTSYEIIVMAILLTAASRMTSHPPVAGPVAA
jgi:hypothetical protein